MMDAPEPPPGRPIDTRWLITFADLIALLLTFFVLLFAMSSVKDETWDVMINSLSQSLSPQRGWHDWINLVDHTAETVASPAAADLDYLYPLIVEKTRADSLLSRTTLGRFDDRLIITLPGDLLFAADSAELGADAERALGLLGETLGHIGNRIEVDGYTDPQPVADGGLAANWELAIDRALVVADALRRAGYTREIVALGLSDPRYDVETGATGSDGRHGFGRQVDVVIRDGFSEGSGNAP
ncbi:MAG: flagellar motor protein MotB [Alphaproteobacteria bacterium]